MKKRLVDHAHTQIAQYIKPDDAVIDATVGNGYDTIFLSELVGPNGRVFGFDLQELAIETATMVLKTKGLLSRVELQLKGHENILESIPESSAGNISAVMFNLGYLPHGNKSVITLPETTIQALDQSTTVLKEQGIISILAYRGHEGGEEEHDAVRKWISDKKELAVIDHKDSEHPEKKGPYFWLLQKRSLTQ